MSAVLRKLQREVFVLTLAEPMSAPPELDGFDASLRNADELEVGMGRERNLNELFAQLNARKVGVISLRNKSNRLEELFMRLVENKQDNGTDAA